MVLLASASILASCSKPERVDVANLKCDTISSALTPREVSQQPYQFVERCVSWTGTVIAIKESQACSIEVPGRYIYLGKQIVDIRTLPSGRAMRNQTLGDQVEEDIPLKCILGAGQPPIKRDDVIQFTGRIIAQTEMTSLSLRKQMRKAPVIALVSIHTLEQDSSGKH